MLEGIIYVSYGVLTLLLGGMGRQVGRAYRTFSPERYTSRLDVNGDIDLPSVTVCIPMRNEQHALINSLQSVLSSTYPRLEILVLDDNSKDDTSALIKSFASEGVRFIPGEPLPNGWLGKNHALQELLDKASGSYIFFMDVDTLLQPQSIEQIVRYMLSKRVTMVSVLPRREDAWRISVLFSPLRMFWEVVFHRRLAPASANHAWMIRRSSLAKHFNGFQTLKNIAQPESKFAAELAKTNEYRFIIGTKNLGISYEKKWHSQLETSRRLLYPMLGKKKVLAFWALIDLLLFLVPYVVIVAMLIVPSLYTPLLFWLSTFLCLSSSVVYGIYTKRVWNRGFIVGALLWPLLVIQEFILVAASIIGYARGTVTWKGRTIRPEAQN